MAVLAWNLFHGGSMNWPTARKNKQMDTAVPNGSVFFSRDLPPKSASPLITMTGIRRMSSHVWNHVEITGISWMLSGTVDVTWGQAICVQHGSRSCHLWSRSLWSFEWPGDSWFEMQHMAQPFRSVGATTVDSFNQNFKNKCKSHLSKHTTYSSATHTNTTQETLASESHS